MGETILPINIKPTITSYAQYSYISAIAENCKLVTAYIKGIRTEDWKVESQDINYQINEEEQTIEFLDHSSRSCTSVHLSRSCQESDEVVVSLRDIKLVDNLSFFDLSFTQTESTNPPLLHIKWNQYDFHLNQIGMRRDNHMYAFYRIRKEGNCLQVSFSYNQVEWEDLYKREYQEGALNNGYFQLHIYFGENEFRLWKNMNFIQLFYDPTDYNTVYLDYYLFPRKGIDASFQCMCQFVDTEYVESWKSKQVKRDLQQYIKDSIDEEYYLNMPIDEYYIPGRRAYKNEHYVHYNLFLGYSDEKKEFYLMGYSAKNMLEVSKIPYEAWRAIDGNGLFVRYKYHVNGSTYQFNIQYVKQAVREFLYSEDSSIKYLNILPARKGWFGLKIFDELRNTEQGKRLLTADKRISYLLYEHAWLMEQRLEFLVKERYLREEAQEQLQKLCSEMVKRAAVIKNLVMMNLVTKNKRQEILDCAGQLRETEKELFTLLYDSLITEN